MRAARLERRSARGPARAGGLGLAVAVACLLGGCSALYPFDYPVVVPDGGDAGITADAAGLDGSTDGGVCDDVTADPDNCGACGVICAQDEVCLASACTGIEAVEGGEGFACAATNDGRVLCWGANDSAQLGAEGRGRASASLVPLPGGEVPIELGVGEQTACAVTQNGIVFCWGSNRSGALGVGDTDPRPGPVQVVGLSGAAEVACGGGHCCAIAASRVQCWGNNSQGQLGDGTTSSSESPVLAGVDATSARGLVAGSEHTCVIRGAAGVDELVCWGRNATGELGQGHRDPVSDPVVVSLPDEPVVVDAGYGFTCAIVGTGRLFCWGTGREGQLGVGSTFQQESPQPVDEFGGFTSVDDVATVTTGGAHTCVRRDDDARSTWCWGDDLRGQIGGASPGQRDAPQEIGSGLSHLGAGEDFTCAVRDRRLVCWGWDADGQLGRGIALYRPTPAAVTGVDDAVGVEAAGQHTCLVRGADRRLECFGGDDRGQLGNGDAGASSSPAPTGVSGVIAVDSQEEHVCAATDEPGLYCWGRNGQGQLASTFSFMEPSPLAVTLDPSDEEVVAVAAGGDHSCVLIRRGTDLGYRCWGANGFGELGTGSASGPVDTPTAWMVLPPSGTFESGMLGAGDDFGCAARDGAVSCWGRGNLGQLGGGDTNDQTTPTLNSVTGATALDVGPDVVCAIVAGELVCWGRNDEGALGPGSATVSSPRTEPGPSTLEGVAVGFDHVCVREASGGVQCRGAGGQGQLGDGGFSSRDAFAPVQYPSGAAVAVEVAAGEEHTCSVHDDGTVFCWGFDRDGRLGTGRPLRNPDPAPVVYAP